MGPEELKLEFSSILDTMFVKCYRPPVESKADFEENWRIWYCGEPKHKAFGFKIEALASVQNRTMLLWYNCCPGGAPDGVIASLPGGLFSRLRDGESVITDQATSYIGSRFCKAPPRRNMNAYVEELDKIELSIQRNVERLNKLLRNFAVLRGPFRMSPAQNHFWDKATACASACCKLLSVDQLLNPQKY